MFKTADDPHYPSSSLPGARPRPSRVTLPRSDKALSDLLRNLQSNVSSPRTESTAALVHRDVSVASLNHALDSLDNKPQNTIYAPQDAAMLLGVGICNSDHISSGRLPIDFLSMLAVAIDNAKVMPVPRLLILVDDLGASQSHGMCGNDAQKKAANLKAITKAAAQIKSTIETVTKNLFPENLTGVSSEVMLTSKLLEQPGFKEHVQEIGSKLLAVQDKYQGRVDLNPRGPTFKYYAIQLAVMSWMHDNMGVCARVGWSADGINIMPNQQGKLPNDERLMQLLFADVRPDAILPAVHAVAGAMCVAKLHPPVPYFAPPTAEDYRMFLDENNPNINGFFDRLHGMGGLASHGYVSHYESLIFVVSTLASLKTLKNPTPEKLKALVRIAMGQDTAVRKITNASLLPGFVKLRDRAKQGK